MGLEPDLCTQTGTGRPLGTGRPVTQELSDVRCPPVFRWFRSMKGVPNVQRLRTSGDVASGVGVSVIQSGPDVRSFASGAGAPIVRSRPDVRWLELG